MKGQNNTTITGDFNSDTSLLAGGGVSNTPEMSADEMSAERSAEMSAEMSAPLCHDDRDL